MVLGQFLSAEEHREWVPAIVGFMHLPDLHCVIYQVVVDDLHMHSMSVNVCTCTCVGHYDVVHIPVCTCGVYVHNDV